MNPPSMPPTRLSLLDRLRDVGRSVRKSRADRPFNVILHLGSHKTGTSLIQKYIRDNKRIMSENKLGYTLRSETNNYIGWGRPEYLVDHLPPLLRNIETFAKQHYNGFIVSHENSLGRPFSAGTNELYPDAKAAIKILARSFRPFRPHIIYYIRSQEQFLESYYLQSIHEGGFSTFERWRNDIDIEKISWAPLVGALKQEFGPDRVTIKSFEREIAAGQSEFLKSFFLDVDPHLRDQDFGNFTYDVVRNPSIGDLGLKLALAANPLLETREERKTMRTFLQEQFSNLKYARPALLSDEEKRDIRAMYHDENSRLTAS